MRQPDQPGLHRRRVQSGGPRFAENGARLVVNPSGSPRIGPESSLRAGVAPETGVELLAGRSRSAKAKDQGIQVRPVEPRPLRPDNSAYIVQAFGPLGDDPVVVQRGRPEMAGISAGWLGSTAPPPPR